MANNLELKVVLTAIDKMTAPIRGIQKQMSMTKSAYQKDMGQLNGVLKSTKSALKEVQEQQKALEKAGKPVSAALIQSEQNYLRQIEETNKAIDIRKRKMNEEMALINKRQAALSRGKDQLRSGSIKVASAVGMTYAGVKFMQPGFDFDEQMSKVQALTRLDKNDPMFAKLREQAEHLGATTWASATQAADAQAFYAMAGFSPQAIMDALPATLDLAKAGGVDVGRAADIGSNILSAFGLEPTEMDKVADILVSVFTRTNTSIEMLGETMKYVGPVARELKIPLEEATAMAGILGNVGIQGSQAGTAMRALQSRLAAPPSAAKKALKELKVSTKDVAGNFRSMPDILADVMKATAKMGNADKLGYLKAIAGEEAGSAFAAFLDKNNYEDLLNVIEAAYNSEGESAKVSKTMSDNLKGDWTGLMSAIESVQIALSGLEGGPLRNIVQRITKIVQATSAWIKENPKLAGWIFKIGTGIIAATAAIGSLTMAMGLFNMFVLANPIVLVISAIIASIAALIYFKDEVWDFFKTFAEAPKYYIQKTIRYMNGLLDSISEWLSNIPVIGPAAQLVFEALAFNLRIIYYLIGKITDALIWVSNTWVSPTIDTSSIENTWDLLQSGLTFLLDIRNSISNMLGEIPLVGKTLQFIFDMFTFTFSFLVQIVKEIIRLFEWINDNATAIGGVFVAMWNSIVNAAQPVIDLFNLIIDLIAEITVGIAEAFSFEMPEWMKKTGGFLGDTYDYFADSLSYTAGLVGEQFDTVFGRNNGPADVGDLNLTPAQPVNNDNRTNNLTINVETRSNASAAVIATETVNAIQSSGLIGDLR